MAHSVNLVLLTGLLGREPEMRELDSPGMAAVLMVIATCYRYQYDDEWIEEVEWNRVQVIGNRQEIGWLADLKKGDIVTVTGRVKTREYEKNGEIRYITEVQCAGSQFHGAVAAMSINVVRLTGRMGSKPELRELDSSGSVAVSMLVVIDDRYEDINGWKEETMRHPVEVVGNRRDVGWLADLQEGDTVSVAGRLTCREYEKDGEKRYTPVVQCSGLELSVLSARRRDAQPRNVSL